jgi:hypothetical protein
MKRNTVVVVVTMATIAAVAAILAAAINPTMQAYAQNNVTATQSNSFSADIDQSQSGTAGGSAEDHGSVDSSVSQSQGFCLQVNQQNAAAGNDATNTGVNAIIANNQSAVDCS